MKTHFCPKERTMIDFEGECNWCGKKEEKEWPLTRDWKETIDERIAKDDMFKEALAQPAQEPVAWNEEEFNAIAYAYRTCPAHEIKMVSDRYQELVNYVLSITHPAPAWQGLSADEIDDFMFESCDAENGYSITDLIKLVEQALKEKNT